MTGAGPNLPTFDSRRSYDADVVDRHIADLRSEIDSLRRSLDDALRQTGSAQEQAMSAQKAEELIGRALLSADRRAEELIADGERRARQIIADAHQQADAIVAAADREADDRLTGVRLEAQRILDEAHESVRALFATLPPPPAPTSPGVSGASAAPATPGLPSWWPPADDPRDVPTLPRMVASPEPPTPAPRTIIPNPPAVVGPIRENPTARVVEMPREPRAVVVRRLGSPPTQAVRLERTGTDDAAMFRPIADPYEGHEVWEQAEPTRPTPATGPLASLMERWRFAWGDEQLLDERYGSRGAYLDSATDGTFIDQLREPSDPVNNWTAPPFDRLEAFPRGDLAVSRVDRARWYDEPVPRLPLPSMPSGGTPRHRQEPARWWRVKRHSSS